ncbi:hypothetical protein AVEN_121831-1 [Araneus ventricosus]|uniref:CCHC-type domain-containing protein n=1 Tax=Araneus ventricosus TaxID=182803 RepID=A0A4Y2TPL9_ARAVE|nr:hypothetical protein AVEN_121831-1 [Araneus ventricosus]
MPRKKFNKTSNYNKNRNEINIYRTRSLNKAMSSSQRSDLLSLQTQQDPKETHEWANVGRGDQGLPQRCHRSSTPLKETKIKPMVVSPPQKIQQNLSRSSFLESKLQSTSMETLNVLSLTEFAESTPISTSPRTPVPPLDSKLQNAIQEKIRFVQKTRSMSYSRMREKDPQRFLNLVEDMSHFADGILISDIVDCDETATYVKSLSFNISNNQSSTPTSIKQLNKQSTTTTKTSSLTPVEPTKNLQPGHKQKMRILHSSSSTRTPSPIIENELSQLDHHTPPPMSTSLPEAEFSAQNFPSDTSDIEGAIDEMSSIPLQDFQVEDDLEVLYTKLKGKQFIPLSQRDQKADSFQNGDDRVNLHEQLDKIRGVLSSSTPDVGKALLLLDQLQADILTFELINIKPQSQQINNKPQSQQKNNKTKNQIPSSSSQATIPSSPLLAEPSLNPTILLFPSSNSSKNLTAILNEELPSKDFNPRNIKSIKGNGLAISFKTTNDIENLQSKIDNNANLKSSIQTKHPKKRLPSLIVYNESSSTKEEAIQEALINQLALTDPPKLRFHFRGSTQDSLNWVFETSATILQTIQKIKKLQIGWSMFRISEFYHIKRCNFCQAYGHTTKDCTLHLPSCGYCADHHAIRDCLSQVHCCINCFKSNLYAGTQYPTSHPAWDRKCPFFQTEKQRYCNTRDYS